MASSSSTVSRTLSSTDTTVEQEQQEANTTLTLKLRKKDRQKKIQWTEDTVDNEGVVLMLMVTSP